MNKKSMKIKTTEKEKSEKIDYKILTTMKKVDDIKKMVEKIDFKTYQFNSITRM